MNDGDFLVCWLDPDGNVVEIGCPEGAHPSAVGTLANSSGGGCHNSHRIELDTPLSLL